MFHLNGNALTHRGWRWLTLSPAMAIVFSATSAMLTYLERPAAAFGVTRYHREPKPTEPQKDAGAPDALADRKLLADLESTMNAYADHVDPSRVDRELAAVFRGIGLDLDAIDPKTAGARLAGRPATAEIAAALDRWCRFRKAIMKVPTWRRLLEVARAADPDVWRNAVRDQLDQPPATALLALRARAADVQALEKQPLSSLLIVAQLLSEANDRPTAAAVIQVADRRFPADFWVCMVQGTLHTYGARKPDPAAARLFAAAVALRPQSPLARVQLARVFQQQNKIAEAERELREAIRRAPDCAEAQLGLGYALEQTGKGHEAISRYREAIRLKPGDAQAHAYLGAALSRQGKHAESIAALREAIHLNPDDADVLLGLAYELQLDGKLDEAVAAVREAVRVKPDHFGAQMTLGNALAIQGKLDEAASQFRAAIRIEPQNVAGHLGLCHALEDQKKWDEAVTAFREANRISRDHDFGELHLGYVLTQAGKLDEALACFREIVRFKPGDAQAHFYMGSALAQQGKHGEAIAEFREAIRLKPDDYQIHFNLGYALLTQGKLDDAIAAYREAIRLKPDDYQIHFNLGLRYSHAGLSWTTRSPRTRRGDPAHA